MRNLAPAVLAKIAQTQGIEPINIVRVYWTSNGYIDYADRQVEAVQGKLLTLSEVEDVIDIQGNSTSTSVSLSLDDTDGSLKEIFNNVDINRKRVIILQWFADLPLNTAFSVFEGEIASPISWSENDRVLKFDVLSKLEDREVGFSAEEASFDWVPGHLVGQAWPLIFGTVNGLPGLQFSENPQGLSGESIGITDVKSNQQQIDKNEDTLASLQLGFLQNYYIAAGGALEADRLRRDQDFYGIELSADISVAEGVYTQYIAIANQFLNEYTRLLNENEKLKKEITDDLLKKTNIPVINANNFPNQIISRVKIGDLEFGGFFSDGTFNVTQQPEIYNDNYIPAGITTVDDRDVVTEYTTQLPPNRFSFQPGGSTIKVVSEYPLTYIAALNHVTVLGVQAFRNGILTGVPPNYYRVEQRNYDGLLATFVVVPTPLSSIADGWEDNLYFTLSSDLDNNPVEIIKYIINTYTTYGYDATSFASVKLDVAKYPMNFAITSKTNAMQLLRNIAYQARCAIWFNDGKFFLKFLPKEATAIETIVDDDVDAGSIEISYTSTEEIITKYVATWRANGSQSKENKIIFRNNVTKYGTLEDTYNYFCYNNQAAVEKMAEFWLIRNSNVFKRVSFRTFLHKLKIETWDTITLDFDEPLVANGPIKALVESARYDTGTSKIQIVCWVPVRAGEMTQFPFAWPAGLPIQYVYPVEGNNPTVPSTPAKGAIADQSTIVGNNITFQHTNPRSDQGRHVPIGDDHDNAGDYGVKVELDNREVRPGTAPNFAPSVYRNTVPKKTTTPAFTDPNNNTVFYGLVQARLDATRYQVLVYTKGIFQQPKTIIVTQFQIRPDEEIPPDTPCLVTQHLYERLDTNSIPPRRSIEREYVMQVPTWVKPQSEPP